MKFVKASAEIMKLFDSLLPDDPRVERRKMFGYPCAFVNKNMFCGVFGDAIMARLPEGRREVLLGKGWKQFEPMPGRAMKEYLVIPGKVLGHRKEAQAVLEEAFAYASSLKKE
ncbi:MAG: TfoX/Sxy family protein [Candidatus Micrarchaeia archaeon]